MTPLRSHSRLVIKSDHAIALTSSTSRRIIYLMIFAVFAVAMVVGFDPAQDLTGNRLFGTIGYGAVMLVLLGVAAYSRTTLFDRTAGRMTTTSAIFGIVFKHDPGKELSQIKAVVLQKVRLLKGRDVPLRRSNTLSSMIEPRAQLFRLFLDAGDELIKIDESSYSEELEREATFFSEFLGVARRNEEL